MFRRSIPLLGLLVCLLAFDGSRPILAEGVVRSGIQEKGEKKAEGEHPAAEAAGHHEEGSPNIIEAQAPLAIWTVIVFVGLLLVLGKYAWKPLMKALAERESHLEQVLLDSERARNEAEAIAAENRRHLAQAADEARLMIEQAVKDGQAAAAAILSKAQAEAEASRQRAEREISGAKDQALMEIWSSTADLAVSVAGKVLSKELGEADHKRLVELAMSELPANGREGSHS
jgi:F-type H+-transporting ATPase subunit b